MGSLRGGRVAAPVIAASVTLTTDVARAGAPIFTSFKQEPFPAGE
jgi:hypothetical protein